jgi:hypothetical protein
MDVVMQTPSNLPALVPSQEFYRDSLSDLLETRSFLMAHGYLRIDNCFDTALAEGTHAELKEDARYTRMEEAEAADYGVLRYEGDHRPVSSNAVTS